jgi:DNA polymerase-3 subunit alpha
VTLLLLDPSLPGEVEIDVGSDWPVNPQVRRALRSLPGVLEVEEV